MMERQYKDSGIEWIGKIPEGWKMLPLAIFFAENSKPNSDLGSVNALQFKYGEIIQKPSNGKDLSEKDCELLEKYTVVAPDDIVVNGLNLNYDLKSLRIAKVRERGIITSAYIVLRPRNGANASYYNYYLKALDFQKIFHGMGVGIRLTLSYNELRPMLLPVPPTVEQQRIASYLDKKCGEIDELIALQEKMIAQLTEYKQAVITEAVTKGLDPNAKLVPSGIEWIGDIPEKWKWIKLGLIFQFKGGYAFDSNKYVTNSNNQVIRIGNVKNDQLLLDASPVFVDDETAELAKKYKLKENYILFTMTGTKGKRDYFYTLILDEKDVEHNIFLNQRVGCLIAQKGVYPLYYNYLLKEKKILDRIFLFETGTANQGNLGYESISRTILQFPPYEEQVAIAKYINVKCYEVDSLITLKRQKIESLNAYKKSVIYEAVTGKTIIE